MKKIIFILIAFLAVFNGNAQIKTPVKWTTKTEKISDTEYNIILKGTIEEGWHLYSQFTPEGGPLPLELKFDVNKANYSLIGNFIIKFHY